MKFIITDQQLNQMLEFFGNLPYIKVVQHIEMIKTLPQLEDAKNGTDNN